MLVRVVGRATANLGVTLPSPYNGNDGLGLRLATRDSSTGEPTVIRDFDFDHKRRKNRD